MRTKIACKADAKSATFLYTKTALDVTEKIVKMNKMKPAKNEWKNSFVCSVILYEWMPILTIKSWLNWSTLNLTISRWIVKLSKCLQKQWKLWRVQLWIRLSISWWWCELLTLTHLFSFLNWRKSQLRAFFIYIFVYILDTEMKSNGCSNFFNCQESWPKTSYEKIQLIWIIGETYGIFNWNINSKVDTIDWINSTPFER